MVWSLKLFPYGWSNAFPESVARGQLFLNFFYKEGFGTEKVERNKIACASGCGGKNPCTPWKDRFVGGNDKKYFSSVFKSGGVVEEGAGLFSLGDVGRPPAFSILDSGIKPESAVGVVSVMRGGVSALVALILFPFLRFSAFFPPPFFLFFYFPFPHLRFVCSALCFGNFPPFSSPLS